MHGFLENDKKFDGSQWNFAKDLQRSLDVTRNDVQAAAREVLAKPRVVLSVVPLGGLSLAVVGDGQVLRRRHADRLASCPRSTDRNDRD